MATVYATNRPIEAITVGNMNEAAAHQLPIPTRLDDTMAAQSGSIDPPPSPRINLAPPPNPPFVFPARPASELSPFLPRTTGRRPLSAIELQNTQFNLDNGLSDQPRRSPALPDFSFNPGATLSPESAGRNTRSPSVPDLSLLSPPVSPHSPKGMSGHMGHRRGGSEFVGGKLRSGGSITVMNTSPIKPENSLAPSPTLAPVPAAGHPRRGHAHRRSGAISSHDLSMILQPKSPSPSQGSSAPTTPADTDEKPPASPGLKADTPMQLPKEDLGPEPIVERAQEASSMPPQPSPKPAARARVCFSDTPEFIPRPLSLVSTDTSSTVRPGHSVSGSISSVMSGTNSTFADRDSLHQFGSPASPVSSAKSGSRPSTAGAVLDRTPSLHTVVEDPASPRRRNSIPLLSELSQESPSLATPSPSRTSKRWSFFRLDPFAGSGSPTRSRPISPGSSDVPPKQLERPVSPRGGPSPDGNRAVFDSEEKCVSGKKKKQKKVKTWAGSILTRKSKSRSHKPKGRRRSQTPPLHRMVRDEVDDDPIETSYSFAVPPVPTIDDTTYPSSDSEISRPRRIPDDDDDTTYPMIDLDAALGPFNTPSSRDPKWDEAQKAGATPKRQLHSAAGLRGFSGPGMHYHRRAESAPEMPPFEAGRFGIHRFGSSSTMADVFEEDEEDDEDRDTTNASDESTNETDGVSDIDDTASTPTQERDQYSTSSQLDTPVSAPVERKGSGSSLELPPTSARIRTDASSISLHEDIIVEEGINYNRPRSEIVCPSSSDGSSSAAPSPRRIPGNRDIGPTDSIVLPVPQMTPASPFSTAYSSSFPSPRSPMSYDAHRISTAASSVADENNFHSLLMGEPGPEVVRISVEVPSLTSSNSTMTRESASAHGVRPRNMPFHEQRPASFTTTAFGRRRSSLASLSRLISSAHGERSKLSVEVPCDDEPEKKQKNSKSRRLSKMIQFWKPKSTAGP
ncbi:hypothetical protein F4809DRAFT_648551 [Biscogniauxia mediterranea]|nr:hypothetical protein F4809DRAFT_648551 [Biscogniauxia mediterranea]